MSASEPPPGEEPARVSLENWYANLAPLSEKQRLSVSRVSAWLSASAEPGASAREAGAPVAAPAASPAPLATDTALSRWLAAVGEQLETPAHARYSSGVARLEAAIGALDALLEQMDAAKINVTEMRAGLAFVEDSSNELMAQADQFLGDQTQLEALHRELQLRLSFFAVLPRATAVLGALDHRPLDTEALLDTLQRLDLAMQFMRSHPLYVDAQLYTMRFQNSTARAMALIQQAFARQGRATADAASDEIRELEQLRDFSSADSSFSPLLAPLTRPLYDEFEPLRDAFRPLFAELEHRAEDNAKAAPALIAITSASDADECRAILAECQRMLCTWRTSLVPPRVSAHLRLMLHRQHGDADGATPPAPLRAFAADGATLMQRVCGREVQLFAQFFHVRTADAGTSPLAEYMRTLGETFLSLLAPELAPDAELSVLAEICGALQASAAPADTPDEQSRVASAWMQPALHHLCHRLLSSAQATVRRDIAGFRPTGDDLAYPERLDAGSGGARSDAGDQGDVPPAGSPDTHAARSRAVRHAKQRSSVLGAGLRDAGARQAPETRAALFSQPEPHVFASWYPPVRTTLTLLATLHTHVPVYSFVELACAALGACRARVEQGAAAIRDRGPDAGMGASLFELRHLYALRELYYAVELASRTASAGADDVPLHHEQLRHGYHGRGFFGHGYVDVGLVLEAIQSIWHSTSALVSLRDESKAPGAAPSDPFAALLRPAAQGISGALTRATSQLCTLCGKSLTLPLQILLDQAQRGGSRVPKATPSRVLEVYDTFQQSLAVNLDQMVEQVNAYVEDSETSQKLLGDVVAQVLEAYVAFRTIADGAGRDAAALPEPERAALPRLAELPSAESLRSSLLQRLGK